MAMITMCCCGHVYRSHEAGKICLACRNEGRHSLAERRAYDARLKEEDGHGKVGMCTGFKADEAKAAP